MSYNTPEGLLQPASPPWVRVVVVNYNGEGFLQAALAGLVAQTMSAFEVVIVDNASTDGSLGNALSYPMSVSVSCTQQQTLVLPLAPIWAHKALRAHGLQC